MYPSAVAPLLRSSSNPDLATDPIAIDARSMTEKMQRTRKFWANGIRTAIANVPEQQQAPSKDLPSTSVS